MELSVCLITYNHEKFIAQALDSILMQEVNYEYEIVVGEDCSTDDTRKILLEYKERYPDKIRLILREKNVGHIENLLQTYKSCKGKYVATLDGDDYWISSHKLQKQVDFLECNNDYSIVFHPVIHLDEMDGKLSRLTWPIDPKDVYTIEDLVKECFLHTAAVVYRNGLVANFPEWIHKTKMDDWTLHILHAQHGRIKCLNDVMAVYRIHGGGVWSRLEKPSKYLENVKFYKYVNSYFDKKYDHLIKPRLHYHYCVLSLLYYELALENEDTGNIVIAKTYATKSVIFNPFNKENKEASILFKEKPNNKEKARLLFRLYLPWGYGMMKNVKFLIAKCFKSVS